MSSRDPSPRLKVEGKDRGDCAADDGAGDDSAAGDEMSDFYPGDERNGAPAAGPAPGRGQKALT